MSAITLTAARQSFSDNLKAVEDAARFAFRKRMRDQDYEESLAEARAAAWSAWHGLVERGKDPLEVGIHGIASNAIRNVRQGRRVGHKSCGGRGAMDIFHRKARAKCGFTIVSLDSGEDAPGGGSSRGSWRSWLAEDGRVTPADQACIRLDFGAWLEGLTPRYRRIAELLAEGHEGVVVSRILGLSPGRISQVRAELEASWGRLPGYCVVESKAVIPDRDGSSKRRGGPRRTGLEPAGVPSGPNS